MVSKRKPTAAKRGPGRPRKAEPVQDDYVDEILDERHKTYGYFINQATISQEFKKVLFHELAARNKDLAPDQIEALEMILHKIARIVNGDENHIDSWHDISGYATLVADRLNGNVR